MYTVVAFYIMRATTPGINSSLSHWLQKRIHHESVVTVISSIPVRLCLDDFYSSSALKPQTLFAKSV